ncbi:MAG TPA: acetolactate synthase catalytic subunit [Burkholderiaceae bacterium]|nr:acetolactate synthase catalytic subunit [Burkholderiaceae bacterium]
MNAPHNPSNSAPAKPGPLKAPGFRLAGKNTAAHVITRALIRHGVTHVFGQSIPSLLMLTCEELGITQVGYRTENAGGYMGDGFSRISGKVCVVAAQNGPAATLLVAAMGEAMKASIPMVALVQDVNRDLTDKNAFQEYDHLSLFAGCTKWARVVNRASRAEDYVDMAFTIAASGRPGPVALMLPADMLLEEISEGSRKANLGNFPLDRSRPSATRIEEAAKLIANARRPVVIAGGGVHLSGAAEVLAKLQEQAHLPVATTMMGKGSVSDLHPLTIGVVGAAMGVNSPTRYQRELITEADVVVLVGNRANQNGTDSYSLYPKSAQYIHIDIDSQEIGRNYEAFRLQGDARETLDALVQALEQTDLTVRAQNRAAVEARIAEGKAKYREEAQTVLHSDNSPIRPERLMTELDALLEEDDIVVSDASYSSFWTVNYLTAKRAGQRFLTPRGMAGLGWGLPMALGARVAAPDRTVYCVSGDGGFGHVWSELETARRMNLKVVLIVLNNSILGFSKHADNVRFGTHSTAVDFAPVDHCSVARGAGCEAIAVEEPSQLAAALRQAKANEVTTLVEIRCDPNAFPPFTNYADLDLHV